MPKQRHSASVGVDDRERLRLLLSTQHILILLVKFSEVVVVGSGEKHLLQSVEKLCGKTVR